MPDSRPIFIIKLRDGGKHSISLLLIPGNRPTRKRRQEFGWSNGHTIKLAQQSSTTTTTTQSTCAPRKRSQQQAGRYIQPDRGASDTAGEWRNPVWTWCWKATVKCAHTVLQLTDLYGNSPPTFHSPLLACTVWNLSLFSWNNPFGEGITETGLPLNRDGKEFARINRYVLSLFWKQGASNSVCWSQLNKNKMLSNLWLFCVFFSWKPQQYRTQHAGQKRSTEKKQRNDWSLASVSEVKREGKGKRWSSTSIQRAPTWRLPLSL